VSDPTLALPFDQYQRYRLVADILESLRPDGEPLELLDVGGRTALLRQFLPGDRIHLVDVEASEVDGLVLGDGSCLPYRTDSVDAVVAFDTLEHVPPARRGAFLQECRRVARSWVVVAGPYDTEGVAQAEEHLTAFLREKMNTEHRYLAEHASHGLPKLDETEVALAGGEAKVLSIGHANLERWLALMCLELYMDRDAPLRGIAAKVFEFYNAALYASDHAPPVYRHAVVAALGDATLPTRDVLPEPPVAPAGSLAGLQHLIEELLRYDVDRDTVTREWDRLEKVNADLLMDLDGHKDTLCILQEAGAEQKKVIEELRASAALVIGDVDALLGEVDLLKETLEEEREERDEVVRTLETDLQGHRELTAEKAAEVEQLRDAQEEIVKTFETDLKGHRELLAEKTAEVEQLRKEQESLQETLENERRESAQVQEALETDLKGHRELLAEKTAEVEQLRKEQESLQETLEDERRESAQVQEALETDLAGHRELVAEQQSVVAEQQSVVAEQRAQLETLLAEQRTLEAAVEEQRGRATELETIVEHLRGEVAGHERIIGELTTTVGDRDGTITDLVRLRYELESRVHQLNVTLSEKQAALDVVRGELTGHRRVIDDLRSAQRDRWANLLRALGLK